jgi:multiple sugar transport system permease protein
MFMLSVAGGIQIFVEPTMLNQVGSASSGGSISPWWSVNQLSFTYAFQQADFGGASALSMELLVVSLLFALVVVFRTGFFDVSELDR